jgi:poly(hydroxyalkanoate) depolymerase family esterase
MNFACFKSRRFSVEAYTEGPIDGHFNMNRYSCLSVLVLVGCGVDPGTSTSGTDTTTTVTQASDLELTSFGSNPGGLKVYAHVPGNMPASAPLVVALHGCTQRAADYQKAGWDQLADTHKFYVLYPEVQTGQYCFSWFDLGQSSRGQGEAASVAQAVAAMQSRYGIDSGRIFVTGLSAGGAMTNVMLATYPDVFSAGAAVAGIDYRCASSMNEAYSCMPGKDESAKVQGDRVRAAFPNYSGPRPKMSIWQGDADWTVRPQNAQEMLEQWADVNGIDVTADATATVGPATHTEYKDALGNTRVELWMFKGMGHGVAVDPSHGCGTAGAFILDVGVCSSGEIAKFFGLTTANVTPAPAPTNPTPNPTVPAPPAPASACKEFNDTNYAQVQSGRAVRCGNYNSYACATATQENLGLWNTFNKSWVHSVEGGYAAGRCP